MARLVVGPRLQDRRSGWHRFRSGLLLLLTVALLGAIAAAVLGISIAWLITSLQHATTN